MSNLSQIKADSNWGDASNTINTNFQNMDVELEKLKNSTTRFKGYFTNETNLKNKFPSPKRGDIAFVGEPYPGNVYDVLTDGSWHNTTKAPETGSVDLQDYVTKDDFEASQKEQDDKLTELGGISDNLSSKSFQYGETDADFAISDEEGNEILRVEEGNIRTRNFDSRSIKQSLLTDADFAISDEEGNEILRVGNGHIQTRNFDSSNINGGSSNLRGKKLSIVGDSISTYNGYIVEGYATFYPRGDVNDVEKTWWKKVINATGLQLLRNASWSGSTITGDSEGTAFAGCSTQRVLDLSDGDNDPDIVIVWISVNDWGNNGKLAGEFTKTIPQEGTITTIADAMYLLTYKIMQNYPNCKLYICTIPEVGNKAYSGVPTTYPRTNKSGSGSTINEYNKQIKLVAEQVGATIIDLHSVITYWNCGNYTIDDLHPNNAGTTLISNYIINILNN